MALAIISLPELAPADAAWLEALRRRHDPQAAMVGAHFTLVFPFEGLGEAEAASHASAIAARTSAIGFRLETAAAVRHPLAPRSHVFLLPGRGETGIRRLHGALYDGPLAPHLRRDIPYAPHVTVGGFPGHAAAKALAAQLGQVAIAGRLVSLQLVNFDGRTVTPLLVLPLKT